MIHRIALLAAIGLCCICAYAEAPKSPPAATQPAVDDINAGQKLALKKLDAVMGYIQLDNAPLSEAVDRIRKLSGEEIFVNWKSLSDAGIDRDTRIRLHLTNKPVSTLLNLLLEIAAADGEPLGFDVDDGVITISTRHDLSKNTITRVYDIRPLLGVPPGPAAEARVSAIEKLLLDQIDPNSWHDHGGDIGSLRELQGQLIVTQTLANHERLATLLENLRPLLSTAERPK